MSGALAQLADLVRRETGIQMQGAQLGSLEAALSRVGPGAAASDFLGSSPELLDRLIDEVTIKETFFFRQRDELDAIDWRALHAAARAAGSEKVRVWVAACASGEEAYTLGMLASEAFGSHEPPVSILATDISNAALDRARRARYAGRSLRGVEADLRARHMSPVDRGAEAGAPLRRLVELRRHNLVRDPIPPPGTDRFELIACRNVLIYFEGETVERVIAALERALSPGGTLVLGAADRLCDSARRLAGLEGAPPQPRRRRPARAAPALRRPLRRQAVESGPRRPELAEALAAANAGELDRAVAITDRILHDDTLDADAYFVRGLAELGLAAADAAVSSLRRALYVDPGFGLAAFQLGRAHEHRGDRAAAVRAYEQALRTLDADDTRHAAILDQVDLGDVAAACALKVGQLREGAP